MTMASNSFAKSLKRNSWRVTTVLVYAFLEWILIFLLLVNGLFQYLITKFAGYFGLHQPCLWCSRIDHVIEPNDPHFYRKLICDRHAKEISLLGYCASHKKLSDSHSMCDGCAFSGHGRDTDHQNVAVPAVQGKNKNWLTCMSVVADMALDSKKKLLGNGDSAKWVSDKGFCSCCNAPLNEDKLCYKSFFGTFFLNGRPEGIIKPAWAALGFSGESDDDRKNQAGDAHLKISEIFVGSSSAVSDVESASKENESFLEKKGKVQEPESDDENADDDDDDDDDESYSLETEQSDSANEEDEHQDSSKDHQENSKDGSASESDNHSNSSTVSEEKGTEECADGLEHLPDRTEAVECRDISMSLQSDMFIDKTIASHDVMNDEVVVSDAILSETRVHEVTEKQALESGGSSSISSSNDDVADEPVTHLINEDKDLGAKSLCTNSETVNVEGVTAKDAPDSVEETSCLNVNVNEECAHTDLAGPKPPVSLKEGDPETIPETVEKKPELEKDYETRTEAIVPEAIVEAAQVKDIPECPGETVDDEKIDTQNDAEEKSLQPIDAVVSERACHAETSAEKSDQCLDLETPINSEGNQLMNKRLVSDKKDSLAEALDRRDCVVDSSLEGSAVSDFDSEGMVDSLKRALESERKALNSLYMELEEERNAAAVAANQTMAMITRLQEEKAAVQMEALQYQRMMEEQAEYDQEALQLLNEILVKREKEKQELEKELEVYRKRVVRYEAGDRRREKRRNNGTGVSGESGEDSCGRSSDQTPETQSRRTRTSSSSSLSDNSGATLSDAEDEGDGRNVEHSDHNTPVEDIMSASRITENGEQKTILDDSMADFEEERLSILEQLKLLEEKLHKLAQDDQNGYSHSNACDNNVGAENGHLDGLNVETAQENGLPVSPRESRAAAVKAKRLLPLFDATNGDEDSSNQSGQLRPSDPSGDWRTVSMVVRDNARLQIEEEVCHVYERLQALEADREFLKHTIKSLRKGDEGMNLLQEIAQHLRDLRRVELKARNFDDDI